MSPLVAHSARRLSFSACGFSACGYSARSAYGTPLSAKGAVASTKVYNQTRVFHRNTLLELRDISLMRLATAATTTLTLAHDEGVLFQVSSAKHNSYRLATIVDSTTRSQLARASPTLLAVSEWLKNYCYIRHPRQKNHTTKIVL